MQLGIDAATIIVIYMCLSLYLMLVLRLLLLCINGAGLVGKKLVPYIQNVHASRFSQMTVICESYMCKN